MATFKGKKGSVTFATNAVAQIRSWTLTCEAEVLDITHMGDDWEKKDVDVGRWNGSIAVSFDYGDTNGQRVLVDRVTGSVPVGTSGAVELLIATGKKFTGSIFISGLDVNHAIRAVADAGFRFVGHDALSISWA